jgi:hypothetical protein
MTVTGDSVAASELENVIAVFGAVDRAVQDDPTGERRARVSALIPAYASPDVHWDRIMREAASARGAQLPASLGTSEESVDAALVALQAAPESTRLAARRLLGLFAATQAVPESFRPDRPHGPRVTAALGAVLPDRIGVAEASLGRDEAARRLHEYMARDQPSSTEQSPDERWTDLLGVVGLSPETSGLARPSCMDTVVDRPGGTFEVVLRSEFPVSDVSFEKAQKILAPENWPRCSALWCRMDPRDPPPHRYYEEVTTNCRYPDDAYFTAHAILDFTFDQFAGAAQTTYNLAPGVLQPDDGLDVDAGALVVQPFPDGSLHVTTTKHLRFKQPLRGAGLDLVACLFGWTEKGIEMFHNCARLPDTGLRRVARLEDDGPARAAAGRATVSSQPGGASQAPATAHIAKQTAATIEECVGNQVSYMQEWAERVDDEEYGIQDMADDMARAGVMMIRDGARIMDLAIRNVQLAGARTPRAATPARPANPDDEKERPPWKPTLG